MDEQYLRDDLPCGVAGCPLCHTNINCKLNFKFMKDKGKSGAADVDMESEEA